MTELSPNAEMSLAQEDTPIQSQENAPMVVSNLVQRMESLDMNPTAEDAYEQAVMSYASSSSNSSISTVTLHATSTVSVDNHQEFLRLLSRFHQAVAPLPKSISKSFTPPQPRCILRAETPSPYGSIVAGHAVAKGHPGLDIDGLPLSGRSRVAYVPSRSYARPAPPRRRTTSAPTSASLVHKVVIPPVFNDMESLIKKADEMMGYMRNDMEEVMKRARGRDRESRELRGRSDKFVDDDDEEDGPLLRKVPVRAASDWYTPPGFPPTYDQTMASGLHTPTRPTITPRRVRNRLALATIHEVTEPGEPLAADAIDTCASKLTSLKIDDTKPAPAPPQIRSVNPIRMYVGYNRVTRPPFVFGTDVVSTQNYLEVAL